MLHLVRNERTYDPETISIMTTAFDAVCRSIDNRDDHSRQALALIILRHVDEGERDPEILTLLAACDFASAAMARSQRAC